MTNNPNLRRDAAHRRCALSAIIIAVLAPASPQVSARTIDVDNPDLAVSLDTSVRYNYAVRTGARQPGMLNAPINNRIYPPGVQPQPNPAAVDEGNYTFDKGDTLVSRVDLFSELDVAYKGNAGLRLSVAGWYDHNFPDRPKQNPSLSAAFNSNYTNGEYSNYVKRFYQGPSGEVLDAFMWSNFDLGGTQLNVKAGRFGWLPGEFLLGNGGSVSYSMSPNDGRKADLSPGASAKETVLPIGQVAATWQLDEHLTLMGNVTTEFRSSRVSEGGTFWAVGDTSLDGPQYINNPVTPSQLNPRIARAATKEGKAGDVALGLKWSPASLGGDSIGFWVRRFDDKNPTWANQTEATATGVVGRAVHARNIDLVGVTYNTVLGGWGSGFEFNVRRNMPLAPRVGVSYSALPPAIAAGAVNDPNQEGPRGTTLHFLYSGALTLNKNALFDAGSVAIQFDANYIQKVTRNGNLFNGDFGGGQLTTCASDAVLKNCATRFASSLGVVFTPTWQQALPSTDISLQTLVLYGLSGNSGIAGAGTLPQGSYIFRPTLRADYFDGATRHQFELSLTKRGGRKGVLPGSSQQSLSGLANFSDRDFVSLTYSTAF